MHKFDGASLDDSQRGSFTDLSKQFPCKTAVLAAWNAKEKEEEEREREKQMREKTSLYVTHWPNFYQPQRRWHKSGFSG